MTGGVRLDRLTSFEVDPAAVLAVPLGATEQHGAHLPLSTDTDVAVALCRRLAAARPDVVVAPAVPYGSSGEHAEFAGTLSIGAAATELLVLELGRSAFDTFARVVFVSAHGGNAGPVSRAVARLRAESRDVLLHHPRWEGEPHAGRVETSLLLALRSDVVDMPRAVAGDPRPISELLPLLVAGGVRAVTRTGVLGDPRGATAAEGAALLDRLAAALIADVDVAFPAAPAFDHVFPARARSATPESSTPEENLIDTAVRT